MYLELEKLLRHGALFSEDVIKSIGKLWLW